MNFVSISAIPDYLSFGSADYWGWGGDDEDNLSHMRSGRATICSAARAARAGAGSGAAERRDLQGAARSRRDPMAAGAVLRAVLLTRGWFKAFGFFPSSLSRRGS